MFLFINDRSTAFISDVIGHHSHPDSGPWSRCTGEVLSLMHTVGHPLFFLLSSYELPWQQRDAVERNSIFQPLLLDTGKGNKKCGSRKTESKIKSSEVLQKNKPTIGIGCTSNSWWHWHLSYVTDIHLVILIQAAIGSMRWSSVSEQVFFLTFITDLWKS